jgi:hypothetical protein
MAAVYRTRGGNGINHSEELPEMGAFPGKRLGSGRRKGRGRKALAAGGATALVLAAAACGSSGGGSGSGSGSSGGGTKVQGGTATYALPPTVVPNYIFPFDSSSTSAPGTPSTSST